MKIFKQPIGIFGGTFDPIHLGHLRLANEAYKQLGLKEVKFMPCGQSPLKKQQPIASAAERLAMINLAINSYPHFYIDDREIKQTEISYTVATLRSIRQEHPNTPLCFIMAMDAFAEFNLWHKYQEIMQLSHLIVANRTTDSPIIINKEILALLNSHQTTDIKDLHHNLAGKIYFLYMGSDPDISATTIRALIKQGKDASYMVPQTVWSYIQKHRIYIN